jgi:hypothetical protein
MTLRIALEKLYFGFTSLLPGPRKIFLPVFKKNSAKSNKNLHFFKLLFLSIQ